MNTGIIASRYAAALLKLVDETGGGEVVVAQVQRLQEVLGSVPEFLRAVDDSRTVPDERKISLFEAALQKPGGVTAVELAPELRKFIGLLIRNGRIGDVRIVFSSFITDYYRSRGIVRGRLVMAFQPGSGAEKEGSALKDLEDKLRVLVESGTGKRLLLIKEVDPSLIGGFLLEFEDQLLDASVSHQLDMIRRQFILKNRQLV